MIANLPFMRKIAGSTLYCVLFALLLSVSALAQQPTITGVSPTIVSNRTLITITGTNFTGSTVKIGSTTITPLTITPTAITYRGVPNSGNVSVTKSGFTTVVSTENITLVAATGPSGYGATRIITDFNGYTDFTTSSGLANTQHNLLAFTAANGNVYATGVNNGALSSHNVTPTPVPTDFRAFPVTSTPGTSPAAATSNFFVFGKAIDGNTSTAVITAPGIAGKTIRDVLTDGINGLGLGTGITNTDVAMILEFKVTSIQPSKVLDNEPDILISNIATSSAKYDYYVFLDAAGNIVGNPVQNNFSNASDRGNNNFDFFRMGTSTPFDTAVPATVGDGGTDPSRVMRLASFRLSEFGITVANAPSVSKFVVFPGGEMDPGFYSFNAGSISIIPVITSQPVSQSVCTGASVNVTFTVAATGDAITYQWQKDNVDIPGATGPSYTVTNVATANLGGYKVILTNIGGSVTSATANLSASVTDTAIWTGATSSDWNTASNWTCNTFPSSTISANIPAGAAHYPVLASAAGTAKNLSIATGASITVGGTGILQIAGTVSNSGTLNAVDGTVAFIGTTGAQTIPANLFETHAIKNLTINNTAGVTLGSATDLTGILAVNAGSLTTGGFLTLKSNASTTAIIAPVGGAINGNVTVERYIPAKRAFRFLSSPTTGGTIHQNWQENAVLPDSVGFGTDITGVGGTANGFDASGSNNPSLYTYLNDNPGTGSSWIAATSTNVPMVAGTPYRMLVRGDRTINQASNNAPATNTTLRTTGTVVTGDHVVTDLNPDAGGFSLIGNIYQAPVDMNALLNDASGFLNKNFFYVWDPTRNERGAYVTVILPAGGNTFNGSVADKYLQPGQACFIETETAGSPTLTFRESYKHLSTATTAVWKTEENPAQLRMTLYDSAATNGVGADGLLIQFGDYSNELDSFDAVKPGNQDENMGTMNADKIMSFESRSMPVAEDIIPISVTQYRKASYVYKVDVNGLAGVNAVLLDKYTNTRTPLANDAQTQIPFTVDSTVAESVAANRFDIVFESVLGIADNNIFGNKVQIYPNPATDNFFIKLPSAEKEINVKLTNALGQNVYNETVTSQNGLAKIQPKTALQSGIYMVSISNGKSTTTQKLIIK